MLTLDHLLTLLRAILEDSQIQETKIKKFQDLVWNKSGPIEGASEEQENLIRELAHDLDYFEPNEKMRAEDSSYYGKVRARNEIVNALGAIEQEKGCKDRKRPPTRHPFKPTV